MKNGIVAKAAAMKPTRVEAHLNVKLSYWRTADIKCLEETPIVGETHHENPEEGEHGAKDTTKKRLGGDRKSVV